MNANSSTTSNWLAGTSKKLNDAGIGTARLDALVLLEDATGKEKSYLLAHPEAILQGQSLQELDQQIERRANHEPLAYIRGKSEFYGREFLVNAHTLEPRPETETMVELLKQLADSRKLTADSLLIDAGTGSGCLAITAKLEFPDIQVVATDISAECIKVAQQNAKKLGAEVRFYQSNLLHPLPSTVYRLPSTLLCNLPYVPDSHTINQAAMQEPKLAIFGGPDGLDLYRELFNQLANLTKIDDRLKKYDLRPNYVLTESLPFQHDELARIAQAAGYHLEKTDDFIQVFKRANSQQ